MMTCAQAILSLFLFSPCDHGGGSEATIQQAVANPARPAGDVARDVDRKPAEVLMFFGIERGMTVLDVFAGGGYYTEILDRVVGPEGKVLSHNNAAYEGFVGAELAARHADDRLPNVEKVTAEANELDFEDGSLDAVLMILAYHDFFFGNEQYRWPRVDENAFLEQICRDLRPGGVLGVIDHVADAGGDVSEVAFGLHRIDPERVMVDMTGSCFDLAAESDLLRHPEDDHSQPAISPELRGKTDRFVYKFIRR
ncbi:MAG: class I SAM-dependent methyltransferase [Xanthomonadales bacterium]|nr:class I SAM-dependent methyltransferase [Xanthomonadales bacterium]